MTHRQSFFPIVPEGSYLASLASVFHSAPVGLCVLDLQFRYVTVNAYFAEMYRLTIDDFIGRSVQEVLPGPAAQIMDHLSHVLETCSIQEVEISLDLPAQGALQEAAELVTYFRSAQPIRSPSGEIVGVSVALTDITMRKQAEAALRESEENLRCTVELTPHIPWAADATGELTFMSPRWHEMTGRRPGNIVLSDWVLALHPKDRTETSTAWRHAVNTGEPYDREYRVRSGDGSWRWMRARAYPRRDAGGLIVRWYGTLENIDDRKIIEVALQAKTDELTRRVREDYLTGLANRRHFDEVFARELERARRSTLSLGLILLDVDHFKQYNDTLGHVAGDECLRLIAHALNGVLHRSGDMAARFGGEEFAIILPNTSTPGAMGVARHALTAIQQLGIKAHQTTSGHVTISAGVAMFRSLGGSKTGPDTVLILQAADRALYRSKAEGRNRITLAEDAG